PTPPLFPYTTLFRSSTDSYCPRTYPWRSSHSGWSISGRDTIVNCRDLVGGLPEGWAGCDRSSGLAEDVRQAATKSLGAEGPGNRSEEHTSELQSREN